MRCPKCLFENPEEAKFCIECAAPMEFHCPNCGAITPATGKFCMDCAHELKASVAASPVDYAKPQSYTPKFLADKILTIRSSIEGERKLVTVLFADVANYTAMAEKLDPETVHQTMDGCFNILMHEVHRYEGTINQFTGDGIMALFGAPVAHEDHAQRACHAALSIQNSITEYGNKITKDLRIDFRLRIGINSGPVVVGAIGDDLRMDYTAVGDTTNIASRLESAAAPGNVLVSENTYKLAKDFFEFKDLEPLKLKGKVKLQDAYQLIKPSAVETRLEASAVRGLTQFVGRKNSLAALSEALGKTSSGSGQVVGIIGEAGVGKSRLTLELKRSLPNAKLTYLEGRCLHYGDSIAYLPIIDIIKKYFDINDGDQEPEIRNKIKDKTLLLDENLKSCLSPFQELLSLKVEDERYLQLEPQQKKDRIFEAVRDVLIRESQNNPLIVVVEDLHWIDTTSEQFLDFLIGWLAKTRIFLILLYRPEYTHQWGSKSYYHKIGLDQLTYRSSVELVRTILNGCEIAPELEEIILSRSSGNPLFIEELTHNLLENGSIDRLGNRCVLAKKTSDVQVPDTIQGIIAARIDRIEDNLKGIMQVASVVGRDFAFRILETITGMREELKSYLLNLQGLEFIYEKSLFPELEYVFKHALTQEVAYNSLLQKRRMEIHEKIGQAIENIYAERREEFYEMLAYHYSKSSNPEKAYQYLKLSGNKAVKNYSNSEGMRFCNEAIKVLTGMPETEENIMEQIEIRLLMAGLMLALNWPAGSFENLRESERLSKEQGDIKSLAYSQTLIGVYYAWKKGDLLLGVQYCEGSFGESEKLNDIGLTAFSGGYLCLLYLWKTDCHKLVDTAPKVIALLEKTHRQAEFFGGPTNLYSVIHAWYANGMAVLGNFEKAKTLLEKGIDFALKIKDLRALAVLELQYGWMQNFRGDAKNAIAHFKNCIKYCEEGQFPLFGIAWGNLGWSYLLLGDFKAAYEFVEKGLQFFKAAEVEIDLGFFYWLRGMIKLESSELKKAHYFAEKALKLSQKIHQQWIEGFSWILLGRITGTTEKLQSEKAEEYILQGIQILEELKLKALYAPGYHYLGKFYADTGQKDKALDILKNAERLFQMMGMDYWLGRTQKLVGRIFAKSDFAR